MNLSDETSNCDSFTLVPAILKYARGLTYQLEVVKRHLKCLYQFSPIEKILSFQKNVSVLYLIPSKY